MKSSLFTSILSLKNKSKLSSKIDENSSLTPKFYKDGEEVTKKVITKVHFGKLKLSKINLNELSIK